MTIEKQAIKSKLLIQIIADLNQIAKDASGAMIVTQNFGDAMLNKELADRADAAKELVQALWSLEEKL